MSVESVEIVLHHYPESVFSEKVRILLGIKGLKWRSLEVPIINKGRITSEWTGGYRRIPVMQIGADFYCDTELICRELEKRFPTPGRLLQENELSIIASHFFDRVIFNGVTANMFSSSSDFALNNLDMAEFMQDRQVLIGESALSVKIKGKTRKTMRNQLLANLALCEKVLLDGRKFMIPGDLPSLLDVSAYAQFWFINNTLSTNELASFKRIAEYMLRMKTFGHGFRKSITVQECRAMAKKSMLSKILAFNSNSIHLERGSIVGVRPADFGDFDVLGTLVGSSSDEIIIERHDKDIGGTVRVHFPHQGYFVQASSKL
mmetsp:Transcript_7222/g.9419  ORF Transcript_7222/g.9419 Transcript_7222/m.9419 type:complete len:318 (+) Transcript_7222:50-1003(+)